jgi:hypothetical protein
MSEQSWYAGDLAVTGSSNPSAPFDLVEIKRRFDLVDA